MRKEMEGKEIISEQEQLQPRTFEVKDPTQIEQAVDGYVAALAGELRFPVRKQDLSKLPTGEQLASLADKDADLDELRLAVKPWGGRSSLNISSKTELPDEVDPDTLSRGAKLALLLEAAARHQAVAQGQANGILDKFA